MKSLQKIGDIAAGTMIKAAMIAGLGVLTLIAKLVYGPKVKD